MNGPLVSRTSMIVDGLKGWVRGHPYISAGIALFFVIAIVGTYTTR